MTVESTPDGDNTPDVIPRSEAKKAFAARDEAKAEAKKKDATISELQQALDAYRAKEAQAEEERQRKAGEFDKLRAKLEADTAKALQAKEQRISELEKAEAQRAKQDRFTKFHSAIMAKAPADAVALEGLMLKAEREGMDVAPEDFNDDMVADAIKRFRGMSEAVFRKQALGVPPGSADQPGGLTSQQKASEILNRYSKGANWRARYK